MFLEAAWARGDAVGCRVCLLVSPLAWRELRSTCRLVRGRMDVKALRKLFKQRLQARLDASLLASPESFYGEALPTSIAPLVNMAASLDKLGELLEDVVHYPRLVDPQMGHARQALRRLRRFSLRDAELLPCERSGRRSCLSKRLFRSFASLDGLVPRLVALMALDVGAPPERVFVPACEVLAGVVHNAKDSKRAFVLSGGLNGLMAVLRKHPCDADAQAAGLAVLLALSARSVFCIRYMAEAGAHETAVAALRGFPDDARLIARATCLLANMSNVPCVCSLLQCGEVQGLMDRILLDEAGLTTPPTRDFAMHLLANVAGRGEG